MHRWLGSHFSPSAFPPGFLRRNSQPLESCKVICFNSVRYRGRVLNVDSDLSLSSSFPVHSSDHLKLSQFQGLPAEVVFKLPKENVSSPPKVSMSSTSLKIAAGAPFPSLEVKSLNGKIEDILKPKDGFDWKMIVVYRGKHCPLCTKYLKRLEHTIKLFNDAGVDISLVSADNKEQLEAHFQQLELESVESFPIYSGMSVNHMQDLGLYASNPRFPSETDHPYAEPGVFIINEEGNVQLFYISNAPFARPDPDSLVFGIEYVRKNSYPVCGTYV